jgi:hypothetical protein
MNEMEVFARVPASVLRPWLAKEREDAYKYLAGAADPVAIHRAQGKVHLVERMLDLLDKSQSR